MSLARLLLGALLLPWALPVIGSPDRPAEFEYDLPPGWTVGKQSPVLLQLSHTDERERASGILVSVGVDKRGTLRRSLGQVLEQHLEGAEFDLGRAKVRNTASGRDALILDQDVEVRGVDLFVAAVAIEADDAFDLALLISPDKASKYDREEEFERFVASLTCPAREPEPTWDARRRDDKADLDQFFWSQTLRNTINAFGGMDVTLDIDYLRFYPDGRALRGLPDDGSIDDVDLDREVRKNPRLCGFYRQSGQRITCEWLDDYGLLETERLTLEEDDDGELDLTPGTWWHLRPHDDLRLDGRFASLYHSSGTIGGDTQSVTSQRSFRFRPDGRFELTGMSAFSFSGTQGDTRTSGAGKTDRAARRGRYRIEGHTLQLDFESGQTERRTFHWLPPDEEDDGDGIVYVDGTNYNG